MAKKRSARIGNGNGEVLRTAIETAREERVKAEIVVLKAALLDMNQELTSTIEEAS